MGEPLKYFAEPPVDPINGNAHRRRQAVWAAIAIVGLTLILSLLIMVLGGL